MVIRVITTVQARKSILRDDLTHTVTGTCCEFRMIDVREQEISVGLGGYSGQGEYVVRS
jgi:hypothetical protein